MSGMKVKQVIATRELSVNVNGIEYELLMIPKDPFMEVDYSLCPEMHPAVRRLIDELRRDDPDREDD